jgi:hypothetical protein
VPTTEKTLRDLHPGDVIEHRGVLRTVAEVVKAFDQHGYPLRVVTFTDGGPALTHNASFLVTMHTYPGFTCPRCGRTSYNPNDIQQGYCGHCHDWTREDRSDGG